METRKKVAVAMSGGVDSSVAAALLVRAGYDVIGVTMQLNDEGKEAVEDAQRVARFLGIRHYGFDFRAVFCKQVIMPFLDEYARGRTPNPCIACNGKVKFVELWRKCQQAFAVQYLATGHYAKIGKSDETGQYILQKGRDEKKDQSYFLYAVPQKDLACFLMPLGGYIKVEIRKMAEKLHLPVANKPESQEICFVSHDDYRTYLKQKIPQAIIEGEFVDMKGRVLGHHKGLPFYTVGQRKGIEVASSEKLYVVRLDRQRNRVVLGTDTDTLSEALIAYAFCWHLPQILESPRRVKAKIRYGVREVDALLVPLANGWVKVIFDSPQKAVAPGQSVVFYDGNLLIGGGKILRALRSAYGTR